MAETTAEAVKQLRQDFERYQQRLLASVISDMSRLQEPLAEADEAWPEEQERAELSAELAALKARLARLEQQNG